MALLWEIFVCFCLLFGYVLNYQTFQANDKSITGKIMLANERSRQCLPSFTQLFKP
jgi:hypothetical protein